MKAYQIAMGRPVEDTPAIVLQADVANRLLACFNRLVDHLAPEPSKMVGTEYVAKKLGRVQKYISQMAREGRIPKECIVPGTGWGEGPYGFYRDRIDEWLENRVPYSKSSRGK